jgi:hypothetical protein
MADETIERPRVIDMVDRLRAENLQARMQNVQLQLQIMQSELQKAMGTRGQLVQEMNTLRDEFLKKYGVDIARLQIHPDGTYSEAPART